MVVAGLIIVSPFLLVAAWAVVAAMRHWKLLPAGVGFATATLLIAGTACGGLLLDDTAESLILRPARVQQRFIGRAVAGPLRLRSFEQFGFQDPGEIWRYTLPAAALLELRRRCRPDPKLKDRCDLAGAQDDRWYAGLLLEGDQLRVDEGLW